SPWACRCGPARRRCRSPSSQARTRRRASPRRCTVTGARSSCAPPARSLRDLRKATSYGCYRRKAAHRFRSPRSAPSMPASSDREALAILNEPRADNTDTYAWVSNGAHDKLYLIMDFYPVHEPGQGNQGLRACNGYRYEFHIGKGASLKDEVVYRIEFTNKLEREAAPSPTDPLGGGNELPWQLTR